MGLPSEALFSDAAQESFGSNTRFIDRRRICDFLTGLIRQRLDASVIEMPLGCGLRQLLVIGLAGSFALSAQKEPSKTKLGAEAEIENGAIQAIDGEWIYKPLKKEKAKPGLYPPEYITLTLTRSDNGFVGEYAAKYRIDSSRVRVSPDVAFHLTSADAEGRKYTWLADDGRKGTFEILTISKSSIRVEWRTSTHKGGSFTSGVATLVRRSHDASADKS